MNLKGFSLVFTLVLLAIGAYFVIEFLEVCNACNPTVKANQTDIIFAGINFLFAVLSAYLIVKRKFSTSLIVSGVIAGLQFVIVGMMLFYS